MSLRQAIFLFTHFLQNLSQHFPSGIVRAARLQYVLKYGNINLKLF